MRTRQRDPSGTPGLPTAPAPPSRDSNPWPLSAPGETAPKLHPRVHEAVRKSKEPGAPEAPRPAGSKLGWLPYLMLVFIAATSLRVAIEAFESGDLEAALGPLIAIVFAAFVIWRRMRKRR